MENNKENNTVPTLKTGSDLGSDFDASSRNQIFADNLTKRRNELGYTQQKISDLTGIGLKTIQNYESGSCPKGDYAIALAKTLKCSLDWLLLGKGPEPETPVGVDKNDSLYNKVETPDMHVSAPEVEYNAGIKDKLIRSQEKLITHLENKISNQWINIMGLLQENIPPDGIEKRSTMKKLMKMSLK